MCLEVFNNIELDPPEVPFSEEDEESFLQMVFVGAISIDRPSTTMYGKHVSYLMDSMKKGLGGFAEDFSIGTGLNKTAIGMEKNIWQFSSAKQYQLNRSLQSLIFKGVSYEDFKPVASKIWQAQNIRYLQSEWQTGVVQSQNARNWWDFQDNEDITLLQYHTQGDVRVRDSHRALNKIKLPKNDAFWRYYYPANGWRCRCFVTGETTGKPTNMSKRKIPEFGSSDFPDEFNMNPGISAQIFSKRHPYFDIPEKHRNLKKNNFNLPLP